MYLFKMLTEIQLNDKSHLRTMHILYALWCKLHLVQPNVQADGPSVEGVSGVCGSPAKQTSLRGASDISVATFSSSPKYVWVCFFGRTCKTISPHFFYKYLLGRRSGKIPQIRLVRLAMFCKGHSPPPPQITFIYIPITPGH